MLWLMEVNLKLKSDFLVVDSGPENQENVTSIEEFKDVELIVHDRHNKILNIKERNLKLNLHSGRFHGLFGICTVSRMLTGNRMNYLKLNWDL